MIVLDVPKGVANCFFFKNFNDIFGHKILISKNFLLNIAIPTLVFIFILFYFSIGGLLPFLFLSFSSILLYLQ